MKASSKHIILVSVLLFSWHFQGLYGFDWTDTTYHFQEAINIANGLKLNQDFFSHVPGLSFLVEGQVLKIFGKNFYVHRNAGLIFPLIHYFCIFILFYEILKKIKKENVFNLAITFSSIVLMAYWGEQIYWNFTYFAMSISAGLSLVLYYLLSSKNIYKISFFLVVLAVLLVLQLFTKQSHGFINYFFLFFAIIARPIITKEYYFIIFGIAFLIIVQLFSYIFGVILNLNNPFFMILSGESLALKGLDSSKPLDILSTIVGANTFKQLSFLTVIFVLVGSYLFFFFRYVKDYIVFVSLILTCFIAQFVQEIYIFAYWGTVAFSFLCLPSFFLFIKNFEKVNNFLPLPLVIIFSQFPIVGSIIAEQLSWPSFAYLRPQLFLVFFAYTFVAYILINKRELKLPKLFVETIFILSLVFSLIFVETIPVRYNHKNEGLITLNNYKTFANWPVNKNTQSAINLLQENSKGGGGCPGNTLFHLSWMPIIYDITNRINVTGYDLPYADTITKKEAKKIIAIIEKNLPDMIVIQPKYRNYDGLFPAEGLKYIFDKISNIIVNYNLVATGKDDFNKFEIYCKKKI
jgi:hypothetical protein